jgi:hypothetical protein
MKKADRRGPRPPKRARLSTAGSGWREGTVQEFLGLSDEESALVRAKAALAVFLQQRRKAIGWSQTALAERLGSGQSRVAKMEAAQPSVSLDLLVRALLVTGVTMPDIGVVIATGDPDARAGSKRPSRSKQQPTRPARGAVTAH